MENQKKQSNLPDFGNIPPQDIDVEKALLSSLILSNSNYYNVCDLINEESFYKPNHNLIYKAIAELINEGDNADILTIIDKLKKNGDLESVGGKNYLIDINNCFSSENIVTLAIIIKEKSIRRLIIEGSADIIKDSYDDTVDVFDLCDKYISNAYKVSINDNDNRIVSNTEILKRVTESIEKASKNQGITGAPTGLKYLDLHYGGRQKGDFIIKAGRPGMGKTAQALCEANHMVLNEGLTVVIFSLEMTATQLMQRLVSINTGIPVWKMRKGSLSESEWQTYHRTISKLTTDRLVIDDRSMTLQQIISKSKKLAMKHEIGAIYVDYIQLAINKIKGGNREQEISGISRSLKELAKDLDVPIIALSQLSRSVETRGGDKKPMLSDLRESGAIEQDADVVEFIYRPEYYGFMNSEDGEDLTGVAYVCVAKFRNGDLKDIKLRFIGELMKFETWERC